MNSPAILIKMEPDGSRPNTLIVYDTKLRAQKEAGRLNARGYVAQYIPEISNDAQRWITS